MRYLAWLALLVVACSSPRAVTEDLAVTNVSVLPMTIETVLPNRTVLVSDGRIVAIQPAGRRVSAQRIIDGSGKFLMPGLIDVHVHLTNDDMPANQAMLDALLKRGITTALILHGRESVLRLRDDIARGNAAGPRILVSTRNENRSDLTESAGRELARQAKSSGYDFIKTYDRISRDGFAGITSAAGEIGIPVAGHVPKNVGLEASIKQGLTRIVHAEELLYNEPFHYRTRDVPLSVLNENLIKRIADLLLKHGVMLSPTLIAYQTIGTASEDPAGMRAIAIRHEPSYLQVAEWRPFVEDDYYAKKFPTDELQRRQRVAYDFQRKMVIALHRTGVPLAAGTDSPLLGLLQVGDALKDELTIYREIGLTNFEALVTATRNGARFLNLEKEIGTLEQGKSADMLLLRGNPLRDLSALRDIEAVIVRGAVVTPRERRTSPPHPQSR